MSNTAKSENAYIEQSKNFTSGMWIFTIATLLGWAAIVLILMNQQVFDSDPPWQTAIAILLPIGLYLTAFVISPWFRSLIYATDPVLLSLMQSWRILGVLFLPIYVYGDLPGGFAWPAGIGDVFIAVLAVFVPYAVIKGSISLNSAWMWALHILGILDLIIAVSTRVAFQATVMGESPLVFIPAYLVPLWIILHLAVIANMRKTSENSGIPK